MAIGFGSASAPSNHDDVHSKILVEKEERELIDGSHCHQEFEEAGKF